MTPKEALDALRDADHAILDVVYSEEIAEALGVPKKKVPIHIYRTTPQANNGKGIVMDQEGPGVAAHSLAEEIADYYGASYPFQHGIGSRLRVAVNAIAAYLKV